MDVLDPARFEQNYHNPDNPHLFEITIDSLYKVAVIVAIPENIGSNLVDFTNPPQALQAKILNPGPDGPAKFTKYEISDCVKDGIVYHIERNPKLFYAIYERHEEMPLGVQITRVSRKTTEVMFLLDQARPVSTRVRPNNTYDPNVIYATCPHAPNPGACNCTVTGLPDDEQAAEAPGSGG